MGLMVIAGVIASAGAFNSGGALYIITGILNIGGAILGAKTFYDKYLNPHN